MTNILVRYGPSPGLGPDGRMASGFTHHAIYSASAAEVARLESTPDMVAFAALVWGRLTSGGYGHMLIGKFSALEPAQAGLGPPKDYAPLYSVIRIRRGGGGGGGPGAPPGQAPQGGGHEDYAIDYRGTAGPGSPGLCPVRIP